MTERFGWWGRHPAIAIAVGVGVGLALSWVLSLLPFPLGLVALLALLGLAMLGVRREMAWLRGLQRTVSADGQGVDMPTVPED